MATQRDEDRPGREYGRTLITACGVLLASASLAALVLTDNAKQLRLAVVGALWAFLLVSITGRFRTRVEQAGGDSDEELRRFYQMELQQEVAARREYELRLEVQMRRELEETRTQELEELRAEVHRLRAELMGIEGPERVALMAQAAGLSPERLRSIQEESRRPVEPPQLPAGFSDSPPVDPTPSHPSVPSYGSDPAGPRLVAQRTDPEPYSPTEFIPAGTHGASRGPSYHPALAAPTHAEPELPVATHAPAVGGYLTPEIPAATSGSTGPAGPEEFTAAPAHRTPDSSGTFGSPAPSPAWSSYPSPSGQPVAPSQPVPTPAVPVPPAATYGSVPPWPGSVSSESHSVPASYPAPRPDEVRTGYSTHRAPEPESTGRHGTPAEAARPDPFDPSNTWPGAFKVSHEERTPAAPARQANWRPAEQPAEWRGPPKTGRGAAGRDHHIPGQASRRRRRHCRGPEGRAGQAGG